MSTIYTALGIDPGVRVVGSSLVNKKLLLRAKTPTNRTLRYVGCYTDTGKFKYFRKISSSERKRLGRGKSITNPLESLDWQPSATCWTTTWNGLKVSTLAPNYIIAPTDYTVYVVGDKMVTTKTLKGMINEDHN